MNAPTTKFIDLDAMPSDIDMIIELTDGFTIRFRKDKRGNFVGRDAAGKPVCYGQPYIAGIGQPFQIADAESYAPVKRVSFEQQEPQAHAYVVVLVPLVGVLDAHAAAYDALAQAMAAAPWNRKGVA